MKPLATGIIITLLLAAVIIPAGAVNLFNNATSVNGTDWSKYYTYKVLNDTIIAPDGTTTADTLNVSGGLANHYLGQSITFASLGNYTLGAAIKKHGINNIIQITLPSSRFGSGQFVNANLSDCSLLSVGTVNSTASVSSIANGFCQVTLKSYATSTGTGLGYFIFTGNTDSTRAPEFQGTGNTTHAIAIWNMSIEFNNDSGTAPPPTGEGLVAAFTPLTSNNRTVFGVAAVQFVDASTGTDITGHSWTMANVTGNNTPITFNTTSANPYKTFPPGNWSIQETVTNATATNTSPANTHFVNHTRWSQDGTGDLPILPAAHILRYNVTTLPVDDESATWITAIHTIGGDPYLKPFSTKRINWVGEDAPTYLFLASGNALYSDIGAQMAWPDDTAYELTYDMQAEVYDRDNNIGYEYSYVNTDGHPGGVYPNGTHGARYYQKIDYDNLSVHRAFWQPGGTVSGLPRMPTILSIADVQSASITHALAMGFYTTDGTYIWPASSSTTSGMNTSFPPIGARVRLKSTFSLSGFNSNATKVLQALKTYGGVYSIRVGASTTQFLAEAGSLSSTDIAQLNTVDITDFEFVDQSSLMQASNYYGITGYVPPEPIPPTASFVPVSTDSITPEGIANVTFHSTTETTGTTTYNWTCRNFTPGNNTVLLFSNNTADPFKQFTVGNWIVNLNVTDLNGFNNTPDFSHQVNVSQLSAPYAAFTKSKIVVMLPSGIYFNDTSDGATSWNWSFGDGGYSDDKNASHRYRRTGRFIVNLTINDGASSALSTVFAIRPSFMEF